MSCLVQTTYGIVKQIYCSLLKEKIYTIIENQNVQKKALRKQKKHC